jgi:serine/threonine protein kinase
MPVTDARSLVASQTFVGSSEPPDELPVGRVVNERYRICGTLGRGGMGVVYEAHHLLIGRKVALKTIAAHSALSSAAIERFRREAQAAASVGSSHVVDVLDMGPLDGGSFYMVLEHLDGSDLAFAVGACGPFNASQAVHVAGQLCDALSAVHGAGIVHRDLKPENVFLIARDGTSDFVKVLDFGVCKLLGPPGTSLTATGELVGTPQFMAPEQVEGGVSDHRTDIHALGAILYFLFAGRPPYQAPTLPKLFVSISTQAPPSLRALRPELPEALDAVVRRALDKDPDRRFQSCQALKTALLAAFGQGDDMSSTLVDSGVRVDRGLGNDSTAALSRGLQSLRARTVRRLGLLAAVGLVLVVAFGSYARSLATGRPPTVEAPTPEALEVAAPPNETNVTVAPTPVDPVQPEEPVRVERESPAPGVVRSTPTKRELHTPPPVPVSVASSVVPGTGPIVGDPSLERPVAVGPSPKNSADQNRLLNRVPKDDL